MNKLIVLTVTFIAALIYSIDVSSEEKIPFKKYPVDEKISMILPEVKPQFYCGYCHVLTYPRVIKKAHKSWKKGKHKDVACEECHYPPEKLDFTIPEHEKIPEDKKSAGRKKTELEYMKTELEVLSKLITVVNMEESVVRRKSRIDDRSCTTSRCHPTTGKGKEGEYWKKRLKFTEYMREDRSKAVVPFVHESHYDKKKWIEGQEMHCATCHRHETRERHFEVSKESCYLCHFKNTGFNVERAKCSLCHEIPTAPLQKQKAENKDEKPDEKPITHKSLEEKKVPCRSCHIEVLKGSGLIKSEQCLDCHDSDVLSKKSKDKKKFLFNDKKIMHAEHVAKQNGDCFNCHTPIQHKKTDFIDPVRKACMECHPDHHIFQKILLAGSERPGVPETKSLMYEAKTNCLGCHVDLRIKKGEKVAHGTGKTCVACHKEKHDQMLERWKKELEEGMAVAKEMEIEAQEAIKSAKGTAPKKVRDEAMRLFKRAKESMDIVQFGNGVHNKKYSLMLINGAVINFEDLIDLIEEGG